MGADIGAGMRSADIPDGLGGTPDRGTCPVCRDRRILLKENEALFRHWAARAPRRLGYPPCNGTGRKPAVLNEDRTRRHLAIGARRTGT
ncbi:hypothetical protein ACFV42_23620 [Streptomyces solisilvae]|uniref:hypothetical protein n=1 Tax=Streptomyces malaysiensis TaxID=92644 RepID=UPI003677053C